MIVDMIEGKFVRLITADKQDALFTMAIRQDDNNTQYMPKINVSLEQQEKWIQSQREALDSVFFLVQRRSGEPIGTFSLYNISGRRAESGRMIIRGNQIETMETVLLFHDYAFFTANMDEVYSEIAENNLPAQGVAKSAGAKNHGYLSEFDGTYKRLIYTAVREDYCEARKKLEKLVNRFAARMGD